MDAHINLPVLISEILRATKWSQTKLANQVGCKRLTIHAYVSNKRGTVRPNYYVVSSLLKIHAEVCPASNESSFVDRVSTAVEPDQIAVNREKVRQ